MHRRQERSELPPARRPRASARSERPPRYETTPERREALAAPFFASLASGDPDGLAKLLAEDVVVYGDGDGKAPQWSKPIAGVRAVARLFAGLGGRAAKLGLQVERCRVNGQHGAVIRDPEGRTVNVISLEIGGAGIRTIRSVINPDKASPPWPRRGCLAALRPPGSCRVNREDRRERPAGIGFRYLWYLMNGVRTATRS